MTEFSAIWMGLGILFRFQVHLSYRFPSELQHGMTKLLLMTRCTRGASGFNGMQLYLTLTSHASNEGCNSQFLKSGEETTSCKSEGNCNVASQTGDLTCIMVFVTARKL